ncbi:MAG: aldehyde dehydrogenase family protein [bacterium]
MAWGQTISDNEHSERFQAISPATGRVIAEFAAATPAQIAAAYAAARAAFPGWRDTPLTQRLGTVGRLKNRIIQRLDEVVSRIAQATGKPDVEALSSDVLVCVDLMRYYERHGESALAREVRAGSALYRLNRFEVSYQPLGVVLIIAPWNHPLQLSLAPLISAIIAGNTVLLKPSELTPTVGELIAELCGEAGLPQGVVQVLQGDGRVGQALVEAGPDKIFFTGSVGTGKAILHAAAERLIPVELELGGNDPMIVFDDAHLERAVQGALYGAFANAGQNCVAVERLYVQRGIHDELVRRIGEEASRLRVGSGREADLGPIIREEQRAVLDGLLQDALDKGARAVTPVRWEGNRLHPVVLAGVDHSMRLLREETFGPILPIMAFDTEDDAVALANDSSYGLNASVWTRDAARGQRVADRLVTGSCSVNDVLKNIGNPSTPFGGVKHSGFGRYHGPEGLRAFCHQRAVMTNPQALSREPNWFPYGERLYQTLKALILTVHSDDSSLDKLKHVAHGVRQLFARAPSKDKS